MASDIRGCMGPRFSWHMYVCMSTSKDIGARNEMMMDDYGGQMIFGDLMDLKPPDIRLTGEEKPRRNLTQETCPDRGSNQGPLLDKRACYHLFHLTFVLRLRKKLNHENWPDRGSNPGPLGERQRWYPSTKGVIGFPQLLSRQIQGWIDISTIHLTIIHQIFFFLLLLLFYSFPM